MGTQQMRERAGGKGRCVELLHAFGDMLCAFGSCCLFLVLLVLACMRVIYVLCCCALLVLAGIYVPGTRPQPGLALGITHASSCLPWVLNYMMPGAVELIAPSQCGHVNSLSRIASMTEANCWVRLR
jgi:hypothetical protein